MEVSRPPKSACRKQAWRRRHGKWQLCVWARTRPQLPAGSPGPEGVRSRAAMYNTPHGFNLFFKIHRSASCARFGFTLSRSPFPLWPSALCDRFAFSSARETVPQTVPRCHFRGCGDTVSVAGRKGKQRFPRSQREKFALGLVAIYPSVKQFSL